MALKEGIHHLWVRLLGAHVLLALLTALLIGVPMLRVAQSALEDAVLQAHRQVAQRAAEEIRHFVQQPLSSLAALAMAMNVERDPWKRQSLLSQASLGVTSLDRICLIDTAGYVRATSALDTACALSQGRRLPQGYVPDTDGMWRAVAGGRDYISEMLTQQGRPVLVAALPVREGGAVVGALVARISLYDVWAMIDQIVPGEMGRCSVVDGQGRFVAHPARELVFQQARHAQAQLLRAQRAGTLQWVDEEGVAWVAGFAAVEPCGWTVVVEQRASAALRALTTMRRHALIIILLSVAGAMGAGLVLLRTITRPLAVLMEAMRTARDGTSDQMVLPQRGDEFRELGEALVEMSRHLEERRTELEAALAFERQLIEDNPLGIAVLDDGFRVVQANAVWMEILQEEGSAGDLLDAGVAGAQLKQWLAHNPGPQAVDNLEITDREDDSRYWNVRAAELPQGYPGRTLVVLDDKTRQRQLEQQITRAERLAALGEMAAGVAHEIRNPLATMQNACDLLKRLPPENHQQRTRAMDILGTQIRRVNNRITGLADFAQPGRRTEELVDVVGTVRELLERERERLQAARVEAHTHLHHVPGVRMSKNALADILTNLVANAIEAMPQGGALTISARTQRDQVLVRIADTGIGIPPERINHIFEPFHSTKLAGFGLGLAMTRRQVEDARGRIQVHSRQGHGSVFTVYLPAAVEKEQAT